MSQSIDTDTIVAVATAPGRGGVGVVRLSGPEAIGIAQTLCGKSVELTARTATYAKFRSPVGDILDSGLCLVFPGPASFTGEDVAELQGHGSPVVLDELVQAAISAGARLARPGEFSERAYLNGKMDLAQAEAVADLINASSRSAARAAVRSLQGEFSRLLNALSADLVALRVHVEAAIDFPDEDIELLAAPAVVNGLSKLIESVDAIVQRTRTGVRLTEGARLVLVGAPNVGKSSVLNCLCGEDRAIVTSVAGTTRDLVREQLQMGGVPVELVDTAGMRSTDDLIEAEGVRRAEVAARQADLVLAIYDVGDDASFEFLKHWISNERSVKSSAKSSVKGSLKSSAELRTEAPQPGLVIIGNKQDLDVDGEKGAAQSIELSKLALTYNFTQSNVSALTGAGIIELTEHLVGLLTGESTGESKGAERSTDAYSARSRHLRALQQSLSGLVDAKAGIDAEIGAELVAEHLRHAQAELGSVCGEISTDELLGEIFSSFCIGK